ncbi:phosphoglycolate phosphatase [Halomonas halocynthiae]|uniref:phosphoglycolate phosphatase n=1 Tax=Halomonas halocynthiae TaxID=176290 RepID=UPI000415648C|nr:phosphoglycolate phosphatase [Halomonas halocynthiae]
MHPLLKNAQLIAFDLDGTLIDSVPDMATAVDAAMTQLGLPAPGVVKVRHWVGNGAQVLMQRALADAVGEAASEAWLDQAYAAFLVHYARASCQQTCLYPGVKGALDGLRDAGLTLVLITNKPTAFIAPLLAHVNLQQHFSLCLGGDSLAQRKPDPMPLLYAAEFFSIAPSRCVMIGDSRHDIVAGKAAGFRTLAVPYGYNHGESVELSHPDGVLESLAQLV